MTTLDDLKFASLKKHRESLAAASTFEEYQTAHLKFIDLLIKEQEAQRAEAQALIDYIYPTEKTYKMEYKIHAEEQSADADQT